MRYLELPEQTRLSFLRGYLESAWRRRDVPREQLEACAAHVCDVRAYADGQRLRHALDGVVAAGTFAALNVAEQAYDDVARELNERWGTGLVVTADEGAELGLRGFRAEGFPTASGLLVGDIAVAS